MMRPYKTHMPPQRQGFTIFEMLIVVTIIGLIAGSILIGRTIIRNAEIQSVITDVNQFKNAAKLFREKYRYLPGDLPNAASLWGVDAGCNAGSTPNVDSTVANVTRKEATCGGNGNGYIGGTADGVNFPTPARAVLTTQKETRRAWQHLANAKMIEGSYTGATASGSAQMVPGLNVPASDIDLNGFIIMYSYVVDDNNMTPGGVVDNNVYPSRYGHIIEYGNTVGNCADCTLDKAGLFPADAARIDTKVDDGNPAFGNVMTFSPANVNMPNCATSTTPSAAAYKLSIEAPACALIFITGL